MQTRLSPFASKAALAHARSGGAVIIIVLTLLSTMVFLGFFFFEFTDLSQKTALAYAEAEDYEIDADQIIDRAHEQLLVGVRAGFEESALWGNKHSILPHIVGQINPNLQPMKDSLYSGTGIGLVVYNPNPGTGVYYLSMDYNGDGVPDDTNPADPEPDIVYTVNTATTPPTYTLGDPTGTLNFQFRLNYSRVAQDFFRNDAFGLVPNAPAMALGAAIADYDPAAGYTYPDLNSLFLAYDAFVTFTDTSGPAPVNQQARVVIPSFFRPQLMMPYRDANGNDPVGPGRNGFANVYTDDATKNASLRPHADHRNYNNEFRFIQPSGIFTAQSGNTNRVLRPFPFHVDVNQDDIHNEMGVFSDASAVDGVSQLYEYDFDADNDGVRDAIWMDLGLPMIDLPDGRQVVPLVAFKVLDADALLNVNAHGNLSGLYFNQPNNPANPLLVDRNGNGFVDPGDARYPIHRSNMGLSSTEVNPTFALFSDITAEMQGAALAMSVQNYGRMGVPAASIAAAPRTVIGATELAFIIAGRELPDRSLPGRHGEEDLLPLFANGSLATPPRAGLTWTVGANVLDRTNSDDNQNMGVSAGLGHIASNPLLNYIASPTAVHPLPFAGTGIEYVTPSNAGSRRPLSALPAASPPGPNPSAWPTYTGGHWHDQASYITPGLAANYNIRPYTFAGHAPQYLMNSGANDLVDEDSEFNVSESFQNPSDAPFLPSENAGLQLSEADFSLVAEDSRLRELASFNLRDSFNLNSMISNAVANRRKFTTDSWDRNEFGVASRPGIRASEFKVWASASTPPTFNGITFTTGDLHFPPQFGAPGVADVGSDADPFRRELRQLLWTRNPAPFGNDIPNLESTRQAPQHRLNLNALLDGFDLEGNPIYRPLVPHPVFQAADTATIPAMYHAQHDIHANQPRNATTVLPTPSGSTPAFSTISNSSADGRASMEWWARYDRQRMARDIYTLLWTVSGGNDTIDYSTTTTDATPNVLDTSGEEADSFQITGATPPPAGRPRVQEMAQFAANVVDALDADDVITRFEYDPDLTDGWSVPSPADNVVYGVEASQLTFSEVMLINALEKTSDFNTTLHDDTDQHQFLYIELRNASPFPVPLEDESWRIVRVPRGRSVPADMAVATDPDKFAAVKFRSGATPKTVGPGETFLVACNDGAVNGSGQSIPSDFYADFDAGTPGLELVVPTSPSVSTVVSNTSLPTSGSLCDLDFSSADPAHAPYFEIEERLGPASSLLGTLVGPVNTSATPYENEFDLVLQRRRNLHARGQGELTAPAGTQLWVEVDRFQIVPTGTKTPVRDFNPANDSASDVNNALAGVGGSTGIVSFERPEPFYPDREAHGTTGNARNHSLRERTHADKHDKNDTLTGTQFSVWEPHFNRPFASVIDLLSMPLYGLQGNSNAAIDMLGATTAMNDNEMKRSWGATQNLAQLDGASLKMSGHRVAAIRFQYPEPHLPTELATRQATDYVHSRNRWYRFLEFVEVPDQTDKFANGRSAFQQRVPGKINLNTVRDESVLAGLVDDASHLDPALNFDPEWPDLMTRDVLTYNPNPLLARPENQPPIGAFTPNPNVDGARNWFRELLQLRDGADPLMEGLGLFGSIPGVLERFERINPASASDLRVRTMGASPFRSLSHVVPSADVNARDVSIEGTILRSRPLVNAAGTLEGADLAAAAVPDHGLFEARHQADRSGKGGVNPTPENNVDYHTRNRLLAKIQNHTTNRSHVFFVWTGIGFFEAHRAAGGSGQVQIGAQAEDIPVRRSFMVCDMSRLEEAYDDPDPTDAAPGAFDFRKFIIYRKLIK